MNVQIIGPPTPQKENKSSAGIDWYIQQKMHKIDRSLCGLPTGKDPGVNVGSEVEERIRVGALKEGIVL